MGTLSFTYGKPRGPAERITEPFHCRWCGDPLRPEFPDAAGLGYRDNGAFCSLRCGFQWAALQFGVRYGADDREAVEEGRAAAAEDAGREASAEFAAGYEPFAGEGGDAG